jgi:Raf kinase inhibitor-like YbhB/YbcL family protein
MRLTSPAFQQASSFPIKCTCDGENASPELAWKGAPAGTKFYALLMHDPDAPRWGGFTHWVVYNIPASFDALPPNVPAQRELSGFCVQGKNDSGSVGYTGPCPPSGTHRYTVRLYALDAELNLKPGASPQEFKDAIRGHVLEQAELMGTYARTANKAA